MMDIIIYFVYFGGEYAKRWDLKLLTPFIHISFVMADIQQLLTQGSLRFSLHIKKCSSSSSSKAPQQKTKGIHKYKFNKCSFNCQKHTFSLTKISKNKFVIDRFGVIYNFCPYHNDVLRIYEGGLIEFNNDRKIQTPAFISKHEGSNFDDLYKERFKDVLARANNETLQTSDQKHRLEYEKKCMSKGKNYPQFEKSVEELKQMLLRKDQRYSNEQE